MIDMVLVKKDMLLCAECEGSDETSQITMLYCVKSGWWGYGLRGEVVDGARRIRIEKLREHQYRKEPKVCMVEQ